MKNAKLTPGSAKVLDDLTKITTIAPPPVATVQQAGTSLQAPTAPTQPVPEQRPAFQLADDNETVAPIEQMPQQEQEQKPAFQMVE